MNENIKEVVSELDRIDNLIVNFLDVEHKIDKRKDEYDDESREIYDKLYPDLPKDIPVFKTLEPEVLPLNSSYAKGVKIGAIGFVASLATWLIARVATLFGIIGYAFLATLIFAIWFVVSYKRFMEDKREYDRRLKRRQNFENIIANSHNDDLIKFEQALVNYYNAAKTFDEQFDKCCSQYVDDHNKLVDQSAQLQIELSEVTLLSQDYIVLAGRISNILKTGRADTFKEALNLAISEKRDEEFKAQQLAEETRRTQVVEQQAYENMLHNQRMEREAAAQTQHAQMQASIAQAQLKATEQQNAQLEQLLKYQRK